MSAQQGLRTHSHVETPSRLHRPEGNRTHRKCSLIPLHSNQLSFHLTTCLSCGRQFPRLLREIDSERQAWNRCRHIEVIRSVVELMFTLTSPRAISVICFAPSIGTYEPLQVLLDHAPFRPAQLRLPAFPPRRSPVFASFEREVKWRDLIQIARKSEPTP